MSFGNLGIPQTTYNTDPAAFTSGQVANDTPAQYVSYPASAAINPGRLLEVVNGKVREAQATNASPAAIVGVSVYKPNHVPNPISGGTPNQYIAGEQVLILRKGRIYADWAGTTQPEMTNTGFNYKHSSTTEANQGVFTDAATATTVGSEISALPAGVVSVASTGSSSVCLVELNLPA